MTKEELVEFEKDIESEFLQAKIKAPVHLASRNEAQLLEFFQRVKEGDWVFSTWRSHYHALLKGIPKEIVKAKIMEGHSITMMFPEYNFFSSAIVGAIAPIAMGTALGIKKNNSNQHVYCFVGDMSATTGTFRESLEYATNFDLPITYVIEDNSQSVGTPTATVWGREESPKELPLEQIGPKLFKYCFRTDKPHVGCGIHVTF